MDIKITSAAGWLESFAGGVNAGSSSAQVWAKAGGDRQGESRRGERNGADA